MSDKPQSAQAWLAVVATATALIKPIIDLFRKDHGTIEGFPCKPRYRKRREYTECKACGATFPGHAVDNGSLPDKCPAQQN